MRRIVYEVPNEKLQLAASQAGVPMQRLRFGKPFEPRRMRVAFYRAKWFLLLAALASVGNGFLVLKIFFPRRFASEVPLVWQATTFDPSDEVDRSLSTRVSQMKIPRNLEKIRTRMTSSETLWQISGRLHVITEDENNVVVVRAEASSAEEAAKLADTATAVFLEHEKDVARSRALDAAARARTDLEAARAQLGRVRDEYDAFRRQHGIADLPMETERAIQAVADLSADAELERAREASRRNTRPRSGVRSGLSRAERAALQERIGAARQRVAQLRAVYSNDHPRVQAAAAEVEELESELESQLASSTTDEPERPQPRPSPRQHEPSPQASPSQDSAAVRLAAQAQQRLAQLSALEGQASALLSRVRIAENHVAELEATLTEASDAARSPASGLRRIAATSVPEGPEPSARRYMFLVTIVGTFLASMLLVFVWANRTLRVFTANEHAYWGRAPVVGASTWPRPPQQLGALVDELAYSLPKLRGKLLVVPATERDRPLSDAVGAKLAVLVTGKREQHALGLALARASGAPEALEHVEDDESARLEVTAWVGELEGPSLRRASRESDRVLVVTSSGALTILEIADVPVRLGRTKGFAYLVLGLPPELIATRDRAGVLEWFWSSAELPTS